MKSLDLLDLINEPWPFVRVRASRDALPRGLALAMVPVIVDWQRSVLGQGDDDHYLVRNVNVGGNPAGGYTTLATVRVPRSGVVSAEYVEVCGKVLGRGSLVEHGQLRLVFAEDRRPCVLDAQGREFSNDPYLDDLVFSYEAWRPPATEFDPQLGLDPSAYALTMRCYAGSQRFLEDSLRDKSWACYPLRFPDVPDAHDELLFTCLVFGDGLARHTVRYLIDHPGRHFDQNPVDYPEPSEAVLDNLRSQFALDRVPAEAIREVMGGEISYQILLRSCITKALMTIDACLGRIHQSHPSLGERSSLKIAPDEIPTWMADIAHSDKLHVLLRIPSVVYWVAKNQDLLPAMATSRLEDAGLLQCDEDGRPQKHGYSLRGDTPYGPLRDNLMY